MEEVSHLSASYNNQKLTPLTESALIAALTVILAAIATFMPLIGIVASLIWALPVVVLTVRQGLKWGAMTLVVSGIIMATLIEPLLSLRMVLAFGFSGIVLGMCLRKKISGAKTLGITLTASVAAKVVSLFLVLALTGINPMGVSVETLKESFDMTFQIYSGIGVSDDVIDEAKGNAENSLTMLTMLMPLVIFLMGAVDTVVNYVVAGRIMRHLRLYAPTLPPFVEWRLPLVFLYLFALSLIGLYWGTTREITPLYQASLNCYMLTVFAGLLQGFSLIFYAAQRFRLGKLWLFLISVVILMSGLLTQVLAFTGLFDMFFDYRRRLSGSFRK